ncbi:MAG: 5'-deoxynucleotidase [Ruminococcaceae bacterium]|nr:5'-deoxynucleotidase [Oscillospiraceae bacterium]
MSEQKKNNSFFAVFFRQKYINRWGLMRNVTNENLSTHAAEVSCLAHALAVIGNTYFGKSYNTERVAILALYHDMPEVFTGDLPTPVKYANDALRSCYAAVEQKAVEQLTDRLPKELQNEYLSLLEITPADMELKKLVKGADKLCALIKCIEEEKMGNSDFASARIATERSLKEMSFEELDYFIENFLPAFEGTIDEI